MLLDVKQLFDIVGEHKEFSFSLDLSSYDLNGAFPFQSPVQVTGQVVNRAGIVTLSLSAVFTMHLICDRCICEFDKEYQFPFSHILVNALNGEDNDEFIVVEDHQLDLAELVLMDLMLQLPSKTLCKEDCKGLCFTCGQNLNDGACKCV